MKRNSISYIPIIVFILAAIAVIQFAMKFRTIPTTQTSFVATKVHRVNAKPSQHKVRLPVVMYHSVLKSRQGQYIVSPLQLENDFKHFVEAGFVAVSVQQLIDFADGTGALPEKPILITFDDGHYNNMYYALPLLQEYKLHAVVNVIGRFSQYTTESGDAHNPNYSHLTWDEIAQLSTENVMEIGNHTYNMHNYKPRYGVQRLCSESDEQYKTALQNDVEKLQRKLLETTGKQCRCFAYPFGKYSKISEEVLNKMGFAVTLTCNEGISEVEFGNSCSLKLLKRINRSGLYDTQTLLNKIDKYYS